jgi:hypothetical protein
MAIPATPQGTLNRVRATMTVLLFPQLTVTSVYLGKAGISVDRTGQATTFSETMTGRVPSPEPYVPVTVTVHLLKSQYLANLWALQEQLLTLIGTIVVRPDATPLQPYTYLDCAIENAGRALDFSGSNPDFPLTIGGTFILNAGLYT